MAHITWDRFDRIPPFQPADGIAMYLVSGDQLMMNLVVLAPNAIVPLHRHDNEQAGHVVAGIINMTIDGETRALTPGDCYLVPGGIEHGATAGPDGCQVLDVFAPPRPDYVEMAARARARD